MGSWPLRRWVVAAAVTLLAAVVIGVPTGVAPSPLYTRMTPVLWWNYPAWIVSSVLEGLLAASYVRVGPRLAVEKPARDRTQTARALSAGLLSAFAVGCPICNKLVIVAIGVSGALSFWAPLQPVLALASVGLLTYALIRRLRTAENCPVPA
ncbi:MULTISPECIES: hypothetical protein [Streptomyces]|uniref:Uncharacterized protein n=1 Tax=Streptomyces venezuelae TaxID=54571 RepID=A0A5P2AR66_STRVZ|nr:hypothetical protein [Streptomyces venezuelae]QES18759.1 hypothetical protein DEJ46_06380 [Streptomyces venezuelae]